MSARFRPVIRVFVSSTFSDLKEERNALQREVFPRLEHYCLVRGFQFQAIDLRWEFRAMPDAIIAPCRSALKNCGARRRFPLDRTSWSFWRPIGWQPLTESLTNEEFAKLEAAAARIDQRDPERELTATEALRTWYRRDNNADPVEYVLRSRYEWPDRGAWEDENAEKRGWEVVEQALWDVINEEYRLDSLEGSLRKRRENGQPAASNRQIPGFGHRAGDLARRPGRARCAGACRRMVQDYSKPRGVAARQKSRRLLRLQRGSSSSRR